MRAWMFAGFGAVLGIAGFAGLNIHPTSSLVCSAELAVTTATALWMLAI